jgi:hypothetical protein
LSAGAEGEGQEAGTNEEEDDAAKAAKSLPVRLGRMRQALANMLAVNEGPELSEGADMILIYLNNIVKYPLVPRFRKIALVNQGYKERLAKVKGHQVRTGGGGGGAPPGRTLGKLHGDACLMGG